jgi:hypothetical protein
MFTVPDSYFLSMILGTYYSIKIKIKKRGEGLLFDCSRTWGFTEASSLPDFVASLNVV